MWFRVSLMPCRYIMSKLNRFDCIIFATQIPEWLVSFVKSMHDTHSTWMRHCHSCGECQGLGLEDVRFLGLDRLFSLTDTGMVMCRVWCHCGWFKLLTSSINTLRWWFMWSIGFCWSGSYEMSSWCGWWLVHGWRNWGKCGWFSFTFAVWFWKWLFLVLYSSTVCSKVLCLINNRIEAFCSIFNVSFIFDRSDPNLDFGISVLKIRQKLRELQL